MPWPLIPVCFILCFAGCSRAQSQPVVTPGPGPISSRIPISASGLNQLLKAYPGHFRLQLPNHLVWNDGTLMPYSTDIAARDFYTTVLCPDLEDQLSIPYIRGRDYPVPVPRDYDPGRIRYGPFFAGMYGATREAVRQNLAPVKWLPGTVNKTLWVTRINGVHQKLQAVSNALDKLPDDIKKYVIKTGGTFNWRLIAGTRRPSPHSYGIAVDIDPSLCHYWRRDYPGVNEKDSRDLVYRNTVPLEIVEIFEEHGFIWGGKWYHYDTMHFEYRPELLIAPATED